MSHRGPDDGGTWERATDGLAVGLAHRRLSIIDLSAAGHQPMTNEDGSLWLTYNGEIYNHVDIRSELEALGHLYSSHTDSETILHAYEQWGDQAVDRFRGMFAFALWDTRRRRLVLVRDRLGVKPLYYACADGGLVFASEIKALLASGLLKPLLDEGALTEFLAFGYRAGDRTMFKGVRKLQPGHRLIWENGHCEISPFWRLGFQPDHSAPPHAQQGEFRRLFEESVRLRLMSDVPLGVFLSGGLDSSAIAAVMGKIVPDRIKTFSVGYEPRYYSEFSFAREVARLIDSDHHEVVLTADRFFEAVPRLTWHEDEPLWGTASVALYFVSELAARSVKVVLTGEGSDELFAGYDRYWMTALNYRALALYERLPLAGRSALRRGLSSQFVPERVRRALSHTLLLRDSSPESMILDNWFGIFPPEAQWSIAGPYLETELRCQDAYSSRRAVLGEGEALDVVDRFLMLDIKTSLVELLMKQDQMSMATSIESRVPFLDHKLVEFAATVPSSRKIHRFAGKHIIKEALAASIPASIRQRKKQGFPVPWEQWLAEGRLASIERMVLGDRAMSRNWFSPARLKDIFDAHRAGRYNMARQIWALWGLECWARIFLEGESPSSLSLQEPMASVGSV